MKLTFLGANKNVTGSRYCLEVDGSRVMIDCGLVQERDFLSRNWEPCPIPADTIEALLLTHAHIDHIGLIPRLVADGFSGPIYATRPTLALADIMLRDSAKIQMEDARYKKRRHRKEGRHGRFPEVPLYTDLDVSRTLPLFRGVDYGVATDITPNISVIWHDAGHILGSASLEILARESGLERTFVFSGDMGQHDKPLIRDPTYFRHADYIVMESTYGDRDHDPQGSIEKQLESVILRTTRAGGNLVIPVFAVERAQEMMFYISRLVHQDCIPDIPVFLDSPMASDVTNIFRQYEDWLDVETRQFIAADQPPLKFPGLHITRTTEESIAINDVQFPCIIMATAGMCNAGRIKHHLKANIRRPESTVLFVGFQAEGTLGRRLMSGEREVRIHGRQYRVEARVEQILGLSGHADRHGLMNWLDHFERPPRKLFLTHGEEEAAVSLQQAVQQRFGFDVTIPEYGQERHFDDEGPSLVGSNTTIEASHGTKTTERPGDEPSAAGSVKTAETRLQTPIGPESRGVENPDFEFLDSSKRRPTSFLYEDPWRVLRIESDMIQGIEQMTRALNGRRRAITVFGSARLPESDPFYEAARETARLLGERGFAIITGGGPGIMEAANRGAREAGALSVGLNIELPSEQSLNAYCDASYQCHYFFVRKMLFVKYARGFVIFPGGFGTLDELFESLTLIQTGKLAQFPVVLVGSEYWSPIADWLLNSAGKKGCVDEGDLKRFRIMDESEEIADWLDGMIE